MTVEEAKNIISQMIKDEEGFLSDKTVEAHKMAIKGLEQEPCTDAISRQAVLDGLVSIAKVKAKSDAQKSLMGRVMFFAEKLPPVTPAEKMGKWILIDEELSRYKCSECGEVIKLYKKGEISRLEKDETLSEYPFSHCGCRMIEPRESEVQE